MSICLAPEALQKTRQTHQELSDILISPQPSWQATPSPWPDCTGVLTLTGDSNCLQQVYNHDLAAPNMLIHDAIIPCHLWLVYILRLTWTNI